MNHSAASPRAALLARARRHFVAIAATSAVLGGGLTAYVASAGAATPSTTAVPGAPTDSADSTGSRSQDLPDSSGTSSGTGLTAPSSQTPPDAATNAS